MNLKKNTSNYYFYNPIFIPSIKYFGFDSIEGMTAIKSPQLKALPDVPIALFKQSNNELIISMRSDDNGHYSIKNLNLKTNVFYMQAHHPTGEFNGVIADNIGGKDVDE